MDLKQQRAAVLAAAQTIIDGAKAAARDLTPEEMTDVEAKFDEIAVLDGKIADAEKSADLMARFGQASAPQATEEPKALVIGGSVARQFVDSDAYKAFKASNPKGAVGQGVPINIEAKGVGSFADLVDGTKATITTETGTGWAGREPGYRNMLDPDEPLTFLDLITTGTTDVAYSEYAQVISETNNAAVVAEGELKPLSDLATATAESKAYTYADGFDVTNQTLADDGALVAFLETRIRQHVLGVVEQKLFNGTGAGTEPQGIMNTTGTLAQAFDTDVVTTLGRAIETFSTANGTNVGLQAIVMNPADIWSLRFLREDGATGPYLLGNPLQQAANPTPWGVPLVPSNKLTAGTALVGRFDSVQYLELEALNVLAFNQHKDYAQRNMSYVRCETRGRQVFYMPREVVVADLTAV